MSYYDNDQSVFVCKNIFCCIPLGRKKRQLGTYLAGILVFVIYTFAMGWWAFVDGLLQNVSLENREIVPGIEDWVPGILTTLGLIVVGLIDKNALNGHYYDEDFTRRVRLFLFLGFALLAGGVAGSVTVLVTKYIYHEGGLDIFNVYMGIMDVVQNGLIMLSTAVLWLAQHNDQNQFGI